MRESTRTRDKLSWGKAVSVAVLLCFVVLLGPASGWSGKKKIKYSETVSAGVDSYSYDSICVTFHAVMWADDFFDGLERIETRKGSEFRKGSRIVKYFPGKISFEIEADVFNCPENRENSDRLKTDPIIIVPPVPQVPPAASGFMSSLQFEAYWKTGFKLRPVQHLSIKEAARVPWTELQNVWVYVLEVQAKDVPLTDRLVVHVLSKDGKKVARFSGHV
ncbi:MAG: hypothetical protein ACE5HL_11380 [Terriglobia bacterium]